MFPIAYVLSQSEMRRSLAGALAGDPVVPDRRPRAPRPAGNVDAGARRA